MNNFMSRYLRLFGIVTILNMVLAVLINHRFNQVVPYPALTLASAVIALFLTGSGWVFRRTKGNPILNMILGFLVILPAVFVMWFAYGIYLFRYSIAIYLACFVIGLIYAVAVIVVSARAKKEAAALNALLEPSQDPKSSSK